MSFDLAKARGSTASRLPLYVPQLMEVQLDCAKAAGVIIMQSALSTACAKGEYRSEKDVSGSKRVYEGASQK